MAMWFQGRPCCDMIGYCSAFAYYSSNLFVLNNRQNFKRAKKQTPGSHEYIGAWVTVSGVLIKSLYLLKCFFMVLTLAVWEERACKTGPYSQALIFELLSLYSDEPQDSFVGLINFNTMNHILFALRPTLQSTCFLVLFPGLKVPLVVLCSKISVASQLHCIQSLSKMKNCVLCLWLVA